MSKQWWYVTYVAKTAAGPTFCMTVIDQPLPQWWDEQRRLGLTVVPLCRLPLEEDEARAWMVMLTPPAAPIEDTATEEPAPP